MPYLGNSPQNNIRQRYYYTATGGQTLFTGADDNGTVLKYQDNKYLDVYLNGVLLQDTIDYTALTKSSVTLLSGATAGDLVEIVAYGVFSVADTVSASLGGTFSGNVSFAANSFVFGNFGIGTNSPGLSATANRKYLTLKGSGTSSGDGCGILQFTSNTPHSIVTTLGNVEWNVFDNSGSSSTRVAYITAARSGAAANNVGSYLAFATKSDGVSGASTERMRIDANGNIGLGVVPSSWSISSGITAFQIKGASLYSSTRELGTLSNAYYNAGWNYIDSAAASQYLQSSGEHYWYTAASGTAGNAITFNERMRISSAGDVGIGTVPATILHVKSVNGIIYSETTAARNTNNNYLSFRDPSGEAGFIGYGAGNANYYVWNNINGPLIFGTNNSERMRIDSGGNMLFGISSTISGNNTLQVVNAATDSTQIRVRNSAASAGNHWRYGTDSVNTVYIINHNSAGVYINNGGTAWSALSDERMKDIIEPITNATTKVAGLRAVIGKYKTDEEEKRRSFLIAQDVQAVLPEAVSIANRETGHLGLSYTDVIPLLVAAIKELKVELDDYKARLSALENV